MCSSFGSSRGELEGGREGNAFREEPLEIVQLDTNLIVKVLFLSLVKICSLFLNERRTQPSSPLKMEKLFSSCSKEIDKIGNAEKPHSGLHYICVRVLGTPQSTLQNQRFIATHCCYLK